MSFVAGALCGGLFSGGFLRAVIIRCRCLTEPPPVFPVSAQRRFRRGRGGSPSWPLGSRWRERSLDCRVCSSRVEANMMASGSSLRMCTGAAPVCTLCLQDTPDPRIATRLIPRFCCRRRSVRLRWSRSQRPWQRATESRAGSSGAASWSSRLDVRSVLKGWAVRWSPWATLLRESRLTGLGLLYIALGAHSAKNSQNRSPLLCALSHFIGSTSILARRR